MQMSFYLTIVFLKPQKSVEFMRKRHDFWRWY
jgi:hypothetical protein